MQRVIIMFFMGYSCILHVSCDINPKWEHPHAWGKVQKEQNLGDQITTQSSGDFEIVNEKYCGNRLKYDVLEIYYLKLVNYLVSKDRLKYDANSGTLKRHIIIEMSNDDIDQFKRIISNVHAIDAKIFEILERNSNSLLTNTIEDLFSWYDKFKLFMSDKIPFEDLQFFVLIIAFLLSVWILSRVFKRNIIITFIGVIFLSSYIFDYMRCCQEKEIEKLLQLQNKSENPCKIQKHASVFEYIAQRFGKTPMDECKQHLMGSKQYFSKEYCDVWDHFIDYLVYKHLLKFIQKMQHFVSTMITETAFPYNIICVAIFLFILKDFLIAIAGSIISNIRLLLISERRSQEPEQNMGGIGHKPREPILITVNLNSRKKKLKPKAPVVAAIEAKESNRIEEITSDEVTSSDDAESINSIKTEDPQEEIKVIT